MASNDPYSLLSAPSTGQYAGGSSSEGSSVGDYGNGLEKQEGYDLEFVSPRTDKYDCPICLLVLREPVQTECGHRFCKLCILKWLRESESRCPVDNQPLEERQLFPDNFAKREILALNVKCPNHTSGCDHIIALNYLQSHVTDCLFALCPCPNECASILLRRDLTSHIQNSCPKRNIQCSMCGLQIVADFYQSHIQTCPKKVVTCPNCDQKSTQQDLSVHKSTECPKEIIHCTYHMLGCTHTCERQKMMSHLDGEIGVHMNLMHRAILFLFQVLNVNPSIQNQGEGGRLLPMENSVLTSDLDTTSSPSFPFTLSTAETGSLGMIHTLFQRLNINPADVHSMPSLRNIGTSSMQTPGANQVRTSSMPVIQRQNQPQGGAAEGSERTVSNQTQVTETSFSSIPTNRQDNEAAHLSVNDSQFHSFKCQNDLQDESLARHDQSIVELQQQNYFQENVIREMKSKIRHLESSLSDMEGRCGNGLFIWKIKNYLKLRNEAEKGLTPAVHSGSFYSGFYGYKLCIRVNLNGVDSAKGTHLSLFIHFMQGEYDDLLEWPFSGRIILTIIDQNPICELRQHISETLMSKPNLAAFQKPITARNHKGFGYMEFVPLSTIDGSTYLKNDTLIIKANVIPNSS